MASAELIRKALLFRFRWMLLYVPLLGALGLYLACRKVHPRWGRILRHRLPASFSGLFLRLNGIKVDTQGLTHIDPDHPEPRILFCNHNSRLDAYALMASCPVPYKSFWSNKDHITLEGLSYLRWWCQKFDMFFVHDKDNARVTAREFRRASEYVSAGNTLSLFPEGTISHDGLIGGFGEACFKLALRSKAVIVPTLILGTAALFEHKRQAHGARTIKILTLPPRRLDGLSANDAGEFMKQLVQEMNDVIEKEARGEHKMRHLLGGRAAKTAGEQQLDTSSGGATVGSEASAKPTR